MNTEEYVPAATPTNRARDRSFSVPAPSSSAPMNRIEPIGSSATTEVLIDRTKVWLSARLAAPE